MKPTELMVGDLVLLFGDTPARVDAIGNTEVHVYEKERGDWHVGYEHIKPIPITPEILEKNGFKKAKFNDNEPSGLCGKWWSKDGRILVKMFELTLMGIVFSVSGGNSRISNIRYVHELQHALRFADSKKEITI